MRETPVVTAATETQLLLVEDTPSLAQLYVGYLKREPYAVTHVETGAGAIEHLNQNMPDILLLDLKLPDMDGIDILHHVTAQKMPTAVIVITAHGSVNTAVDCMRAGARDFIMKPFNADRLKVTLQNVRENVRLTQLVERIKDDFDRDTYCGFIGNSLAMQAVYRIIDSAAGSKATVFITGESGTGKEVCAEAIHQRSPRAGRPFVPLNCAAIPRDLMESEIFGHVKGAFTGATADRDGAAKRADGGTLFLDELCEMDLDLQAKLLRFVQTGVIRKVGGNRDESVDVRIACATNRDPRVEVAAGRFREDLYYRLHVIPVELPPLRRRDDDVIQIAESFLHAMAREEGKRLARFDPAVRMLLLDHGWPGNVRELQNLIRNIVVLNDGEIVTIEMLPASFRDGASMAPVAVPAGGPALAAPARPMTDTATDGAIEPLHLAERRVIERAIALCGGNIPKAAAALEISASTIYRKKAAWGVPA